MPSSDLQCSLDADFPKICMSLAKMRELLRSNDVVLVSYITDLLAQEGVVVAVFDGHMSVMEGSIGAFPRRVMVGEDDEARARRLLNEAGLREQLTHS
jgi:hypothetical protein